MHSDLHFCSPSLAPQSSDVHLTYIYKLDLADPAGQASADLAQKVRLSIK